MALLRVSPMEVLDLNQGKWHGKSPGKLAESRRNTTQRSLRSWNAPHTPLSATPGRVFCALHAQKQYFFWYLALFHVENGPLVPNQTGI